MATINTKYGQLKADSNGKVFWADNKVWQNWPELKRDGIIDTCSPDGYLLEICLAGYSTIVYRP